MPQTGIPTETECVSEYTAMKLNKTKYSYLIFGMDKDYSKIQIIKKGEENETYDDFVASLPLDDCRYAVVNIKFSLEDGGEREKLLFVQWSPSKAKLKSKMLYSTSKEDFKKQLNGVAIELQANGPEEVTYAEALEKCMQFAK